MFDKDLDVIIIRIAIILEAFYWNCVQQWEQKTYNYYVIIVDDFCVVSTVRQLQISTSRLWNHKSLIQCQTINLFMSSLWQASTVTCRNSLYITFTNKRKGKNKIKISTFWKTFEYYQIKAQHNGTMQWFNFIDFVCFFCAFFTL